MDHPGILGRPWSLAVDEAAAARCGVEPTPDAGDGAFARVVAAPHFLQNFTPAANGAPQEWQTVLTEIGLPQVTQNRAPDATGFEQDGHLTATA